MGNFFSNFSLTILPMYTTVALRLLCRHQQHIVSGLSLAASTTTHCHAAMDQIQNQQVPAEAVALRHREVAEKLAEEVPLVFLQS